MSREPSRDAVSPRSGASHGDAETLFAECLDRFESEGERAIDAACERRPDLAPEIRSRFETLRRAGLVGPAPTRDDAFPERLGEFKLLRRIGGGGMGIVYLAEQTSLGRRVALKLIRPENLYFPSARERFRREVEAVARAQHPGVVPIHAVGDEGGIPFYAMEWIDGKSLLDVLNRLGGRAPERLSASDFSSALGAQPGGARAGDKVYPGSWTESALRIALRVAEALQHVHESGVIHRDVKPSNVMLTASGRVVLLDFGLARSEGQDGLTKTGAPVGSLPYMAPEQVRGDNDRIGARTDVYALGVTLYELLTLRVPYRADSPTATQRLIVEGEPEAIRARNRAVSRDAETVCLKAMDRDPARRYASAAEFARDLENVLERRPIEARRASPWLRAWRWVERHPATTAVVVASLLVMGLSVAVAWRERTAQRTIRLLSDAQVVRSLVAEANSFWPADIGRLDVIDRWIGDAEAVIAREGFARRALSELRARASTYTDADRAADAAEPLRLRAAVDRELASLRRKLLNPLPVIPVGEQRQVDILEAAIETAERESGERRTWRFDRMELVWEHGALASLVGDIAKLSTLLAAVREQRTEIIRIHETALVKARDRWEVAIQNIASLPVYGGLVISPQRHLVPLWRDPRSGLWEFWHVPSGSAPALRLGSDFAPDVVVEGESGVVLVLLPGGRFEMGAMPADEAHPFGSPNVDPAAHWKEGPVHTVELHPFFVSKYELTRGQAERFGVDDFLSQGNPLWPTRSMDYFEAREHLRKIGLEHPTEAQWEYACRGGTSTPHAFGWAAAALVGAANFYDLSYALSLDPATHSPTSGDSRPTLDDGFPGLAPVGSFRPNRFGLHDFHGNVAEWCRDVFVSRAYRSLDHQPIDGLLEAALGGPMQAVRGGSLEDADKALRSAMRVGVYPAGAAGIGVRPTRRLDP